MNTNTKTLTVRQWVVIMEAIVNEFGKTHSIESFSDSDIRDFAYGVKANNQLRDFLLGLPLDISEAQGWDSEEAVSFCGAMLTLIVAHPALTAEYRVPLKSGMCLYYMEIGNDTEASKLLDEILEVEPDYSLANLLKRSLNVPWEVRGFEQMRNECHPKVKERLNEIADEVLALDN